MPTQELYDLALLAVGHGFGPLVGSQVRRFGLPLSPELAALGVGLVAFFFGDRVHRAVKLVGAGLAAGAAGALIARYISGLQLGEQQPVIGAPISSASEAAQMYAASKRFLK